MSFMWNETNINELRRLHGLGWSGTAIAQELGTTKNSVNTKRHRMGLSKSIEAMNAARSVTVKAKRRAAASLPPKPWTPSEKAVEDHMRTDGRTIMDDDFGGCRWPIGGEGADTRFCCHETDGTYCAAHHQRAYTRAMRPDEMRGLKRLLRRTA